MKAISITAAMRLLGVQSGATRKQVRKAWRRLAQRVHPDHGGGDTALFRRGREAYELLLLQPFPLPAPTRSNGNGRRRSGGRPMEEDINGWDNWEPPAPPPSILTDTLRQVVKDGPQGAAPPPISLEDALERLPDGAELAVQHRWNATGDPWDTDYAVWAAHFPAATPDGWCVGLEGLDEPGQPEPVRRRLPGQAGSLLAVRRRSADREPAGAGALHRPRPDQRRGRE